MLQGISSFLPTPPPPPKKKQKKKQSPRHGGSSWTLFFFLHPMSGTLFLGVARRMRLPVHTLDKTQMNYQPYIFSVKLCLTNIVVNNLLVNSSVLHCIWRRGMLHKFNSLVIVISAGEKGQTLNLSRM